MSEPTVVNPTELAVLLGVDRSRFHFEVKNAPLRSQTLVSVEMFIDGKDLTEEQTVIARKWLSEKLGIPFTPAGVPISIK